MTLLFDAVYRDGVLRPKQPGAFPDGTEVPVAIETRDGEHDPLARVIGFCDGPAEGDAADAHDEYIYGKRQA